MSQPSYPNSKNIVRHVMSNGIIVLLYENPHSKTVMLEGSVWAGAAGETRAKAGLASMTASSLMRGTANRSFEQIYAELEAVGATVGFASGYQTTEFSADSLTEDLDLVLDIAVDCLRNPIFPEAEIEKVRAEKMTRLYMRQNDTGSMAQLNFRKTLFNNHPYGQSVTGYLDSAQAIHRDNLAEFASANYAPNDAIVVLVGNVKPDVAIAKLEAALGDWENPTYQRPAGIPDMARPAETVRVHHALADKTQADLVFGLPGPRRSEPDYMDARLANNILGIFGMMGRLGANVRVKQGLAYYARSVISGGLGPSPWYVSTGVSPDKVEQALVSSQDEIRRMQNELVSAEELADTQAYLTGSVPMTLESNVGIAGTLFNMELYGLGLDYLLNYNEMVNAVTRERIQAAAQKHFSADQVVVSVAGP
ncbi:MAG: M16 family metallopeptidase [Candidatus Promineifilaceae bacterium]